MWILAVILGNLTLFWVWIFIRTTDLSFSGFWTKLAPLCLLGNLFYWYAFRTAPDFITVRYLMSGMTHLMGWLIVVFILKEPIMLQHIVGAGLIVLGAWIMGKGGI